MTPEQQRIKIAEACPTVAMYFEGDYFWRTGETFRKFDPLQDLNAMHEAEKFLTNDQWLDYDLELMVVTNCDDIVQKKRISATAKQRADAFCAVLGLDK